MSSTSIVTSKHNALLNVAGQTARSIPDLEHAWLTNELGLTSGNSISIPDLWKLYLVAFGIEEAHIDTMIDEWLTEGGYTGSDALQEMWEDKAALLFSVLSPQASGEISVEPINGTGSATFARSTVAYVRDHDNVYHEVPANEARIQGARRDAGIYYWQLADGTPLHPVTLKAGQNVFARYDTREDSTAYVVGDNTIPATGSGPAGGNGYWYQVTAITTGTSGGSAPTFPETIGDTVVDGGITIQNMGHYKLAGYLGEPAAENIILQSNNLGTIWAAGSCVVDESYAVAPNGLPEANQLLDDSAGGTGLVQVNQVLTVTSGVNVISAYAKADQLSFVCLRSNAYDAGGNGLTWFDLTLGTVGTISANHTAGIQDVGDGWYRCWISFSTTTDLNGAVLIYVCDADNDTTVDLDGTSSILAWGVQVETGVVPSSPIITTTVAVTRNADVLDYVRTGNIEDLAGALLFSILPQFDEADASASNCILSLRTSVSSIAYLASNGNNMQAFDGTNTPTLPGLDYNKGDHIQGGVRWSDASDAFQTLADGVSGTELSYDGAFATIGGLIRVLNVLQDKPMIISDIRIYSKDLGQTVCESLTSSD